MKQRFLSIFSVLALLGILSGTSFTPFLPEEAAAAVQGNSPAQKGDLAGPDFAGPDFAWYDGLWPHERSDIRPDADIRFGRLPNGLRYALVHNELPQGRVSLQLDVQAGSLMEEADEGGYAHFIEHMAFNGSRRFAPGALIPFFQQHGMGFGSDTNAYTSQRETVYKLNLASSDESAIAQGLDVLRDFADGLTFSPEEVEAEKGVILAEKRDRENEVVLSGREWLHKLYGSSRLGREIIGTERTLQAASSEKLLHFYRKWYRADRMVLVVVGDGLPENLEALVEKAFADMKKPDTPLEFPVVEAPVRGFDRCFVQNRPVDFVVTTLLVLHPRRHLADTRENELCGLLDYVAGICLQNRLTSRSMSRDAPWTQAMYHAAWRSGLAPSTSLMAFSSPEKFTAALDALQAEYASALAWGFGDEEVQSAISRLENGLRSAVADMPQRKSEGRAGEIVAMTNGDTVVVSPKYALERFPELRGQLTPAAVHQALKQAFEGEKILYISGRIASGSDEVLGMWDTFEQREAQKPAVAATEGFPYLPLPPAPDGAEAHPALTEKVCPSPAGPFTMYETVLAGGVRVHLVPLPEIDRGHVRVSLIFGQGLAYVDEKTARTARLAEEVMGVAGPGRLSVQDGSLYLGSKGISVGEMYGSSAALLLGDAPDGEFATLLQALWTQYADPLPDDVATERYAKVQDSLSRMHATRFDSVDGVTEALGFSYFLGSRFQPLDDVQAAGIPLDAVRAFVRQSREIGLRDVIVAGSFEPAEVLPQIVRFFGQTRAAVPGDSGLPAACVFPNDAEKTVLVDGETVDKAVLHLAWHKTVDRSDRRAVAVHSLLASVLRDCLRDVLREKMGATYSPFAVFQHMESYGGFGLMLLEAVTSCDRLEEVKTALDEMIRHLAETGVSADELERLKKPMLTAWQSGAKVGAVRNRLVLSEILTGQPKLRWNTEYGDLLAAITAGEVSDAARELFAGKGARLVIRKGK